MAQKHTMGWLSRAALGFGLVSVLYVGSYFAAMSIAVRTGRTWPTAWAVYSPIPHPWKESMLRFWLRVDPRVRSSLYAWWEPKFGHLGRTTEEILEHANTEPPGKMFAALNYRIRQKRDLRGERSLSTVEKRLWVLSQFDIAVGNLEFMGYFKSEKANDTPSALEALKEIGATNAVAILQRAMAVFPGGRPPGDALKRREMVEQIAGQASGTWVNCNADYFYDNKTVYALALAHAKKMRTEIVLP
jgi:hypothetical protein